MSSGKVYVNETKTAAKNMINGLEELTSLDKDMINIKSKMSKGDIVVVEKILREIKKWAKGSTKSFYEPLMQSKVMLFSILLK